MPHLKQALKQFYFEPLGNKLYSVIEKLNIDRWRYHYSLLKSRVVYTMRLLCVLELSAQPDWNDETTPNTEQSTGILI